jgi:hypothetical protein
VENARHFAEFLSQTLLLHNVDVRKICTGSKQVFGDVMCISPAVASKDVEVGALVRLENRQE